MGIAGWGLLACTFATPPATPTVPPSAQPAAATALPTLAQTATLRPTATNLPTFTPASGGIATPIPIQVTVNGGGGSASVPGSSNNDNSDNPSGGVAPVGVRDVTVQPPSTGGSGRFVVGVTPTSAQGNQGSFSVQANVTQPNQPIDATGTTPTVPARAVEQYIYPVAAGRNLIIFYDIEVLRGTVVLWVVAPSGEVVWQQGFTETIDTETEINVPEAGDYTLYTYTQSFSGAYQVSYGTR